MTTLIMLGFTMSSLFMIPLMLQPLSLGLMIMVSTLLMCSMTALMLSPWYGYILFLIYVGGLLVMFAYVAALSPNILFGKSTPFLFFMCLSFFLSLLFYFYPLVDLSSFSNHLMFTHVKYLKVYGVEMVSPHMTSILIGLATILLINLIVVVKICYYQHASLRPFKE